MWKIFGNDLSDTIINKRKLFKRKFIFYSSFVLKKKNFLFYFFFQISWNNEFTRKAIFESDGFLVFSLWLLINKTSSLHILFLFIYFPSLLYLKIKKNWKETLHKMLDKCKKKQNNKPEGPKPVSMFKLLSFANRWVKSKKKLKLINLSLKKKIEIKSH